MSGIFPCGDVVDAALRACNKTGDTEFAKTVYRTMNIEYFKLCRDWPWQGLRAKISIDFTGSDDTGMWLPSDLFGIEMVRDSSDGYEFYPRDRAMMEPDEYGYRYFRYRGESTDGFYSSDAVVEKDSGVFSSDDLAGGDWTGYYARLGNELGFYLLTAPLAFSPTYRGESIDQGAIHIRPKETEKIVITDIDEEALHDRGVEVYYWKAPEPLYKGDDLIVIPSSEPLELMLLKKLPEAKAKRPVSQNELEASVAKALRNNPDFRRSDTPRDKHNKIYDLGTNFFKRRLR